MCPCRCKGSVAWHNTCNSNSTGLDIPCCQSCQCRCKGSPVASLNKRLGHSLLSIVPMSVQGVTSCFVEQRLGHSLLSIVPMSVQGVTSCFVEQRLGHSLLSIVPMSVQGVTGCFVHTPAWTFHVFFQLSSG